MLVASIIESTRVTFLLSVVCEGAFRVCDQTLSFIFSVEAPGFQPAVECYLVE